MGSHVCKGLAMSGFLPVTYDNLFRGHATSVKWGPLECGDVRDAVRLAQVIERWKPQVVLHFAALAYVAESVTDPADYYDVNVCGTQLLLRVMRQAGVRNLVFSSSCTIYGVSEGRVHEGMPPSPINPYGRTKAAAEQMIGDYSAAYQMKSARLRYFNAAGADPDGETGENHDPEPHLIPRALLAATGKLTHVDILGDDYPTPDGTCVRDYVHVSDLAQAHVQAANRLVGGGDCLICNLGTGRGYSVKEVLDEVERVTARIVPRRVTMRRPGDPPILVADANVARTELGFVPRYSDMDSLISTAWAWLSKKDMGGA